MKDIQPAFPVIDSVDDIGGIRCFRCHVGMTKREYFAAAALQSLVAKAYVFPDDMTGDEWLQAAARCERIAKYAVMYADALAAELDK